jgi:hypothetical protein
LIKKKIEKSPRRWHEVLSEALWAHRISKHGATKVMLFELVFGQGCRIEAQDALSAGQYNELMMDRVDEATNSRLIASREMEKEKLRTTRAYNKRVKEKSFQVHDLV